ncbi:hydrogenase maturation factor [Burkholderia sp. Ac-20353]|uniref:hydrogenase maturation factor n=1 Tax=Burkholderia sp. Ac-20353 TaxID=2703894 RepID=UPI00197B8A6E|nr:hydrogenase maturation factor [Burkholderia sp. Ac-20353]MBN3789486.1 hydrogenase maturation factor [Burkholderia sp. Ac-20353]
MTSKYTYRGYTIEVRCEHHPAGDAGATALAPGYVAVVQVREGDTSSIFFSPVRLSDDTGKPFADTLDALSAGRAAGEIIVDDLLTNAGFGGD